MLIKTKFDVGEKVWVLYNNRATQGTVNGIEIDVPINLIPHIFCKVAIKQGNNPAITITISQSICFEDEQEIFKGL